MGSAHTCREFCTHSHCRLLAATWGFLERWVTLQTEQAQAECKGGPRKEQAADPGPVRYFCVCV